MAATRIVVARRGHHARRPVCAAASLQACASVTQRPRGRGACCRIFHGERCAAASLMVTPIAMIGAKPGLVSKALCSQSRTCILTPIWRHVTPPPGHQSVVVRKLAVTNVHRCRPRYAHPVSSLISGRLPGRYGSCRTNRTDTVDGAQLRRGRRSVAVQSTVIQRSSEAPRASSFTVKDDAPVRYGS